MRFFALSEEILHAFMDEKKARVTQFVEDYFRFNELINSVSFASFVLFALLVTLQLWKKLVESLKQDIWQSRGIFNLIPIEFFEDNHTKMESLILFLKG